MTRHLRTWLPLSLIFLLTACSGKPRIENLLLISLDTTRADFLDLGHGSRAWTPELRRFAAGSWVFANAYSPIPQTLPAHLTAFSGRLPHQLGVFGNESVYDGRQPLLQQVLQRRGWDTTGIVSLGTLSAATGFARGFCRFSEPPEGGKHFFIPAARVTDMAVTRLERFKNKKSLLFVHYSDPHTPYAAPGADGRFTIELDHQPIAAFNAYTGAFVRLRLALAPGTHRLHLRAEAPAGDFDYFIIRRLQAQNGTLQELQNLEYSAEHYGGSHLLRGAEGSAVIRCRVPGEIQIFQVIPILTAHAALEQYRREVEYLDRQLGRLLRALERSPAAICTAVVIFADHGEGLGEREGYWGHARYLNRQFIHVPLIVRLPGEPPRRIAQPVGLSAIAPWLLEALAIEDSEIPAASVPLKKLRSRLPVESALVSFTFAPAAVQDRCSVIRWPFQLILSRNPDTGEESREYYDLRLDCFRKLSALTPGVLFRQEPMLRRQFGESLPLWRAAFARRGLRSGTPSRRHLEKLKALGYVNRP